MHGETLDENQELTSQVRERLCIPLEGTWFYRQKFVLDQLNSNRSGFAVAWDNGRGGKVYGFYLSALRFYECLLKNPVDKRYGYELICENTKCKGYLDVEWIGPLDVDHKKLQMITAALRAKLLSESNIIAELYVACGSRKTSDPDLMKHSYHIVIDNVIFESNHDGTMKSYFSLDTTDEWYYTGKDGKRKYIIDLGVYTRNRLFRLPLCCKADDPLKTPLVLISGDPLNDDFGPGDSTRDVMPMVLSNANSRHTLIGSNHTLIGQQVAEGVKSSKQKTK